MVSLTLSWEAGAIYAFHTTGVPTFIPDGPTLSNIEAVGIHSNGLSDAQGGVTSGL